MHKLSWQPAYSLQLSFQKVHTDGLLVVLCERAFAVPLYQGALAHRAIADHNHLDGHFQIFLNHPAAVQKLGSTKMSKWLAVVI